MFAEDDHSELSSLIQEGSKIKRLILSHHHVNNSSFLILKISKNLQRQALLEKRQSFYPHAEESTGDIPLYKKLVYAFPAFR